jgi:hypothetical protein
LKVETRNGSQRLAPARFQAGIRPATSFIEPTGFDIRLNSPIPFIGHKLFKPPRESGQITNRQLSHSGFEFV